MTGSNCPVLQCNERVSIRLPACSYPVGRLTRALTNCSVSVVVSAEAEGPSPASPAAKVRAAFEQHATATGWPWKVSICQLASPPQGGPAVARIDLSRDDTRALADLILRVVADPADSPGTRNPSSEWISTAHPGQKSKRSSTPPPTRGGRRRHAPTHTTP